MQYNPLPTFVENKRLMARLYINKDIAPDADKMRYWLSGDDCISFSDIQSFFDWMRPDDNRVDVEIHSCGGECTEGYAIYDALRASGKEISCKVVGKCASMATVILLAAPLERRTAYEHSQLCIHNPYFDGDAMSGAMTIAKLESLASDLRAEKEKMLAVYMERTGTAREALEAQMNADSWFSPEKAIELGFISSVVPAISAKANKPNINQIATMGKEKETTVKQSLLDRLLAKCGYAKIEDVPAALGLVITTSTGEELTVEREEGEIQVGDPASPDGEHVLEDGRTIVVTDGVITEIKEPGTEEGANAQEEEDTAAALQAEIDRLKAENEELRKNAKTEEDNRILASVAKAGGEKWLTKAAASTYTPATRTNTPSSTSKTEEEPKPVSKIETLLAEKRAKQKERFNKRNK